MNHVSESIKEARKSKGYTQQRLADELKVTQSTVQEWESGKNEPTIDMLSRISEVLNVPFDDIINRNMENRTPPMKIVPISHKIPVVDMAAAAGYDPVFNKICDLLKSSDEEVPCVIDRDDIFAIRISGDSMEPTLYDGDIIAVDPNELPSTGKLAVVSVLHEGLLVKRWYWRNGTVRLESLNPAGKTFEWPVAQVQTEGLIRWRWKVLALLYRAI